MGARSVRLPDIGEGVAEAEIVEWSVKVGDLIREGQVVAAVMTDKATVEIPTPVAGAVLALGGEVGETLAVGSELIRIDAPGLPDDAPPAGRPAPVETTPEPEPPPAEGKPLASPAVRLRAREAGVELRFVQGTGPAGRIIHDDLDAYLRRSPGAAAGKAPNLGVETIKVVGLRRRIAHNMAEATRRVAPFTYVEELDVTALEELRAALNAEAGEAAKLTLLPFLMLALVKAVAEHPQINAHYDDEREEIRRFGAVHLGVATQTPQGLAVPVVRHAETLDLYASAREMKRVTEAARRNSATREELTGSTITLSSLGALGGIVSTPVVNRPEVAIVGVNRIVVRPVWRDGAFQPRKTMNLSSSFDHRVVDGFDAASFIQRIRKLIETPALLFIERPPG
jgi:2-oxoisovalerate dehydrogenase E2 component (dihydrolipoyl transacylase)